MANGITMTRNGCALFYYVVEEIKKEYPNLADSKQFELLKGKDSNFPFNDPEDKGHIGTILATDGWSSPQYVFQVYEDASEYVTVIDEGSSNRFSVPI